MMTKSLKIPAPFTYHHFSSNLINMESSRVNLTRTIFVCSICATQFTKSCNLSRHMKNKHDISTRDLKATLKCPLCENKRATYT
ncbi:hypothetical protein HUJ04_011204 [Dendroctonus ponderosae]|nr:hypothetical protein HUJ04_011204 [Dendroctonus ponderosae]